MAGRVVKAAVGASQRDKVGILAAATEAVMVWPLTPKLTPLASENTAVPLEILLAPSYSATPPPPPVGAEAVTVEPVKPMVILPEPLELPAQTIGMVLLAVELVN